MKKKSLLLKILGVRVSTLNIPKALDIIDSKIVENGKGYITVTGVHGIIESQRSNYIKEIHNQSFLTVPDGMPLVWIGKLKGFKQIDRCYGPDLMLAVMKNSVEKNYSHFFYGGNDGVVELLKEKMEEKFPGINVAGIYTPPFRELNKTEEQEFIIHVNSIKPDIVWVGLSTPKQEIFMYEYLSKLEAKIMIGVGAAFDFHIGKVKQAPHWMQRSGLEWFFRLNKEPRRLWKRYLINNPLFLWKITLELLKLKKY